VTAPRPSTAPLSGAGSGGGGAPPPLCRGRVRTGPLHRVELFRFTPSRVAGSVYCHFRPKIGSLKGRGMTGTK
jgi:hypothetical protein